MIINKDFILDFTYPIGSIYMSVNSTSPEILFGGTWEQLQNRFLIGASNTYTAGSTGGSATRTLGRNNLPPDTMVFQDRAASDWSTGVWRQQGVSGYGSVNGGNAVAFSIMPPYLAVYMWKRIS